MTAYAASVVIGVALSALWIGVARKYPEWEQTIFGYSLVLAGLIYVLFGLIESRMLSTLAFEAGVGLGFILLAVLGLRGSYAALGIGWIAHGAWDVSAPWIAEVSYLPWFLEPVCVGFDFIAGTYLLMRSQQRLPVTT